MAAPRFERLALSALGVLGAVAGVAGSAAARCAGGGCASCLACALPVAGLVAAALAAGRRRPGPVPLHPRAPGARGG